MKIKNWTKLSETRWRHESGIEIYVVESRIAKQHLNIPSWEIRYRYADQNKILDRAETKDQAIKKAINAQKFYNTCAFY